MAHKNIVQKIKLNEPPVVRCNMNRALLWFDSYFASYKHFSRVQYVSKQLQLITIVQIWQHWSFVYIYLFTYNDTRCKHKHNVQFQSLETPIASYHSCWYHSHAIKHRLLMKIQVIVFQTVKVTYICEILVLNIFFALHFGTQTKEMKYFFVCCQYFSIFGIVHCCSNCVNPYITFGNNLWQHRLHSIVYSFGNGWHIHTRRHSINCIVYRSQGIITHYKTQFPNMKFSYIIAFVWSGCVPY